MSIKENYIRVTEVLSPFSGLSNIPTHILENASKRGELVHKICTALISDLGVLDMDNNLAGYINSFEKWSIDKKFLPIPDRFYCDKYMITGEIDGLYEEDDGIVLFDIKTPVKESKTWPIQGSAYAYLARVSNINIKRVEFIKLSKEGKDPTIYTYKENFELFLHCLETYKYFYKDRKEEDFLLAI